MTVIEMSLANDLITIGQQSNSVMHKLVKLCASFERSTEWAFAGLPTPAHWIAMNLDVEVSTAREWILCFPPFAGGKLLAAVDAKVMTQNASADASSLAQQRADALVSLITEGPAKVETEVIIHVRADGCSLDDGTPIPGTIVEKLAPEAFIRTLIHDAQNNPINASKRQRHPTTRQKRVVKERDRNCVDCGSSDFEQYDHVPDFQITKQTIIDELQLRCSRCHARRHRGGAGAR